MKKVLAISSVLLAACSIMTGCGSDRDHAETSDTSSAVTDFGYRDNDHDKRITEDDAERKDKLDGTSPVKERVDDAVDGAKDAGEDIVKGAGEAAKDIADGMDGERETEYPTISVTTGR